MYSDEVNWGNMRKSIRTQSSLIAIFTFGSYLGITGVTNTFAFPSIQQQQSNSQLQQQQSRSQNNNNNNALLIPITKIPSNSRKGKYEYSMVAVGTLSAGDDGKRNGDVSVLGRYSRFVDEKPLLAKSMTAGIVTTMANIFSQVIVPLLQQQQSSVAIIISWRRVMMFMITGLCFIGPYLHVWYGFLDRTFAMPQQTQMKRTAVKVIVDQTIGLCIFFPLYFIFMELAESVLIGRVPMIVSALAKCRTEIAGIAIMNWRIWPLTNAINFGIIPVQLRVLVNQVVSFFWFAYLSTL